MRNQTIKTIVLSMGLLCSSQAIASGIKIIEKSGHNYSHEGMVKIFENAKKATLDSPDHKTYIAKHKKYKENSKEPFSLWEERIYKDFARTYKKLFTQDIVPNIDATIAHPDFTPNQKIGFLLDTESEYQEKTAIVVWNNLISKHPDSKNARSAFCKVAAETGGIKGRKIDEKNGEICDKDFQLDPNQHFKWSSHRTPEVIKSIIIAPKLK